MTTSWSSRGIREAGRAFAVPTYLFAGVMLLVIVVGLIRELFFTLPHWHVTDPKQVYIGARYDGEVFGTQDAGKTWQAMPLPGEVQHIYSVACG